MNGYTLNKDCKMLNFTISYDAGNKCEMYLTTQPKLDIYYEVFCVQLLECPAGSVLLNGSCVCDPILAKSDLHIETCYVEQTAIKRPANSWISSHMMLEGTKYLLSTCPLDYCLSYSTAIDLTYPDLQCQFNRTGILCSQCQHGLSMVFGSSRCVHCTNIHILIILIIIVAGIVLVVLLYFLNLTVTVEPPLSGPLLSGHLHCPDTSIVRTAQIGHVACSLLTIMKFGLDESTRREPKGCCLPV